MDNTHLPPGDDEQANHPTEQFWSRPGQAAPGSPGGPGYGQHWPGTGAGHHQPPGLEEHDSRDRRRVRHWGAGLALVALLAGGAIVGVSLAGHPAPVPVSAAADSARASQAAASAPPATGQAAVLNAALSSADSPTGPAWLVSSGAVAEPAAATAGTSGPAYQAVRRAARCLRAVAAARAAGRPRLARAIRRICLHPVLRALALHGVHGEFTFRTRKGFKTLAFERGTIQSVSSGQDIVVRAPDGTTWTWDLTSSTVVREAGQKTSTSALSAGEQVWAGGPVVKGAMDARLIVIRPQSGSASTSPPA